MSVQFGKLDRVYQQLWVAGPRQRARAQAQRELEGLLEVEDQYKVQVVGRAEEFPSWSEIELEFDTVFVQATGTRNVPFHRPHFTYGAVVLDGGPIGLMACVTDWKINRRNETLGCTLAVGATATDIAREFRGEIDARFQGYGAPVDDYGDSQAIDIG